MSKIFSVVLPYFPMEAALSRNCWTCQMFLVTNQYPNRMGRFNLKITSGGFKKRYLLEGPKKSFFAPELHKNPSPQRVYCSWNYIHFGRWTFESRCMLVRFICLLCLLFESTKSNFLVSWFTLFLLSLHFCWLAPKTYGEKNMTNKSVVNSFSFLGQIPHFFNPFQWLNPHFYCFNPQFLLTKSWKSEWFNPHIDRLRDRCKGWRQSHRCGHLAEPWQLGTHEGSKMEYDI